MPPSQRKTACTQCHHAKQRCNLISEDPKRCLRCEKIGTLCSFPQKSRSTPKMKELILCPICRRNEDPVRSTSRCLEQDIDWIACDSCDEWYHTTCLSLSSNQSQPCIRLQVQGFNFGEEDNFICSTCLGNVEATNYLGDISRSTVEIRTLFDHIRNLASKHKPETTNSFTQTQSLCDRNDSPPLPHTQPSASETLTGQGYHLIHSQPKNQQRAVNKHSFSSSLYGDRFRQRSIEFLNPDHMFLGETEFVPVMDDRFRGFQENMVHNLVRIIQNSIIDYSFAIQEQIEIHSRGDITQALKTPLMSWSSIDTSQKWRAGRPWYESKATADIPPKRHSDLTAVLRAMMGTKQDCPLEINPEFANRSFYEVHTSFVASFVSNILHDLNIFDERWLPGMVYLQAGRSAASNLGNERWSGYGRYIMREFELRAWHKVDYHPSLLKNEGQLSSRLEKYLEPLTKEFQDFQRGRELRSNILRHTIKLWSYLACVNGQLDRILPNLGVPFDPDLHEIATQVETEELRTGLEMVAWVLRPGFILKEQDVLGLRCMISKALVILN